MFVNNNIVIYAVVFQEVMEKVAEETAKTPDAAVKGEAAIKSQ